MFFDLLKNKMSLHITSCHPWANLARQPKFPVVGNVCGDLFALPSIFSGATIARSLIFLSKRKFLLLLLLLSLVFGGKTFPRFSPSEMSQRFLTCPHISSAAFPLLNFNSERYGAEEKCLEGKWMRNFNLRTAIAVKASTHFLHYDSSSAPHDVAAVDVLRTENSHRIFE